jgi:hypothetical protein
MPAPSARWLPQAPAAWNVLRARDPSAAFSQDPGFVEALAAVLPGFAARFLVIERGAELVGGMAVLTERRGPWCWWHAMPYLLPGAPLTVPGEREVVDRACARAAAEALREERAVGGEWVGYRPLSPVGPPLEIVPGETRTLDAWVVDLDAGLEAARARLDRETRRGIRLAMENGLEILHDPAGLQECYALHRAQSRAWAGHRALPLELSRRLVELPGTAFLVARRGGERLAGVLALSSPAEAFVWWSGARPQARASHTYAALLWGAVEWAAGRGCRRINLGASTGLGTVEAFKLDLGGERVDYPVRWLASTHAGMTGRLLARLQGWRRRGRHRGRAA